MVNKTVLSDARILEIFRKHESELGIYVDDAVLNVAREIERETAKACANPITWNRNVFLGDPPNGITSWYEWMNRRHYADVTIRASASEDWKIGVLQDQLKKIQSNNEDIRHAVLQSPEIQQALEDTKRLDFLADKDQTVANVLLPIDVVMNNMGDMRAAIDEVMEAKP